MLIRDRQTHDSTLVGKSPVKEGSMKTRMPAVYIAKYNRFLDNILGRINKILATSYDPVRVKLQNGASKKNKNNTKSKKKTKKRPKGQYRVPDSRNKMAEFPITRAIESEVREPSFILISKTTDNETVKDINETIDVKNISAKTRTNTSKTKKKNNKNKTKGNSKASKKTQKTRATLYGLSTIRRDGDVSVNMIANYTTVKTNFILGPLTLRVEKEFGRGAKREIKSAIATTNEMYGRLNLRIMHGGAATLHNIRVLQPKQVKVESKDNHDKTKEYVWKRSSHIAHVVSSKLAKAAKSMLRPPPVL